MFNSLLHFSLILAQITLTPASPARSAGAQDPLSRDTPQSAVVAFLEACRTRNYSRATRYLDLRRLPSEGRIAAGTRLARQLEDILDRDSRFDVGAVSRDPAGDLDDSLPANRETIASFKVDGKTASVDMERITLPSGLEVWIFAASTLDSLPLLESAVEDSAIERHLPAPLVQWKWLDTALWRWIALALMAVALIAVSGWLSRAVLLLLRLLAGLFGPHIGASSLELFVPPVRMLVVVAVFRAGLEPVSPSVLVRLGLTRSLSLLFLFGLVWICTALVDVAMARTRRWIETRDSRYSFAAFQLGSRVLKIVIVLAAATALIGSWGFNTGTVWAGLGVGGLALALAAQKTIENLFGGVSVISDRPVAIGDLCRFDNRMGTVEDIGLRSTRLRTPERTLVTVPNAQFSAMTLENFSRRDKILFRTVLNLRRETTPEKLRTLLESLAQMLGADSRLEAGKLPVRFVSVGSWSFDVEIAAYVRTVQPEQFLAIQQELLVRILQLVAGAGISLATPGQEIAMPAPEPAAAAHAASAPPPPATV